MRDILLLTHRTPYPPDKGDRIRSYHLLRFLATQGRVWLGCLADSPPTDEVVEHLRSLTEGLEIVPLGRSRWAAASWSLATGKTATEGLFASRRLRRTVSHWTRTVGFDAAVVFCSSMAQYLVPELSTTPVLFDCVDVDSEKWLQFAQRSTLAKRLLYGLEGRRLRRVEQSMGRRARVVTLVTEPEADIFRQFAPQANVLAVPNGVRSDYFAPMNVEEEPDSLVFVGDMSYAPNAEGVCWFARNVWPLVRSRRPGAVLRVVGRNPTPAVQALSEIGGIKVVGEVPDVRPFVAQAAVSIAPLHVARGVQNKILEAMCMGRAVVASPAATMGIEVIPGRELLCADTPAQWADAIDLLLRDTPRRRALAEAGRRFIEREHQWDRCLQPLSELLGAAERRATTPAPSPQGLSLAVV